MADFVFNIAKGKAGYYAGLPAANDAIVVVLVKSSGLASDATLKDLTTLSAVLSNATECDFTNYVRKTAASVTGTVDNTNDWFAADAADIVWTSAGGAANNTFAKAIFCYDGDTTGGTDANIIPLCSLDFAGTTNGANITLQLAAVGFYKAA